jgi:hypothetical protein
MSGSPLIPAGVRRLVDYLIFKAGLRNFEADEAINEAYLKARSKAVDDIDFLGFLLAHVSDIIRTEARRQYRDRQRDVGITKDNLLPPRLPTPSVVMISAVEVLDRMDLPAFSKSVIQLACEEGVTIAEAYSNVEVPELALRTVQMHARMFFEEMRCVLPRKEVSFARTTGDSL